MATGRRVPLLTRSPKSRWLDEGVVVRTARRRTDGRKGSQRQRLRLADCEPRWRLRRGEFELCSLIGVSNIRPESHVLCTPVNSVLGGDGLRLDSRTDTQSKDDDSRESITPTLLERRWVSEIGYAILLAGAVTLVLSPVLRRSGWLLDQGTTGPLLLVQMYAAHIRHLDLFPVWSSSDGVGMGSPILLYYHHLFFYLAGTLSLLGLGLKASVVTAIAIFLVIGAYGMRRVLTLVTTSRLLCVVGSLGFLFTNYIFTDWFVPRGDPAEFSALMIVPWLLYWCLALVKFQRFSYLIIPIMVLLLNAHSAIALDFALPAGDCLRRIHCIGRCLGASGRRRPTRPFRSGYDHPSRTSTPGGTSIRPDLRSADEEHRWGVQRLTTVPNHRKVSLRRPPSVVRPESDPSLVQFCSDRFRHMDPDRRSCRLRRGPLDSETRWPSPVPQATTLALIRRFWCSW